MKKQIIIILMFLSISGIAVSSYIIPSGGFDGKAWYRGSEQYISWTTYFIDTTRNIDILLWNADSSSFSTIATHVPASGGYYFWTIPSEHAIGNHFRVKVMYSDNYKPDFSLMSADFFSIEEAIKDTTIEIHLLEQNPSITIYPNPATNEILVESKHKFFAFEIISVDGKILRVENFPFTTQKTISLVNLASGKYILRVKFFGSAVVEHLIIVR
ncbi:MAG: T9SS type A sorting domain-containing protein [Ignavibacteria bacterium]|jgi:hypothetical protein|nr:T9SS type A sorting domain-containing protein [Ignavibacteria bacterium]